ncbi:MAG: phenylalanine--tRNA ligase subunit alpha [Parcubacteria group bacterium RIFCSPLOWO2_01_FULL_48_18]|nr:MAG: phenylalanine--tRNA ligase subunit alpha [Parcubacteria group bacterium RIFCSPLOWO2_01_FULL_48_18]OHB22790.1 MAG: phenylalanine--tRNA ligase subunit alpha [Parcubacteria group bacterium RIFCSPHIGHO2_02_FULL_48_10b]
MNLEEIKQCAPGEIKACKDAKALEAIRVKYLGRKGELTAALRTLKDLSQPKRRSVGQRANKLKNELELLLEGRLREFARESSQYKETIDITAPGKRVRLGHLHPLTKIGREAKQIFSSMGFAVMDGPEIETEYYNFDALNIPPNHPARDLWDTFWLRQNETKNQRPKTKNTERLLLRTHTSPVQIRYMETHEPPFQIIVPGRVFRYEATDASHEINFYQIEGLMVSKTVSLANFKYVVESFFKQLFNRAVNIRLRPSYFPFVEPGIEVDVSCTRCSGWGCSICKQTGWLEVMGAGMVHPHVFEAAHYNPRDWQGFAFGMGLDRIAMLKYNIPDIRLFYSGDLRFIRQF